MPLRANKDMVSWTFSVAGYPRRFPSGCIVGGSDCMNPIEVIERDRIHGQAVGSKSNPAAFACSNRVSGSGLFDEAYDEE